MLRVVGVLIGSVLAIAVLIIAVGVPVLTPTDVGPPPPVAEAPQQVPVAAQAAERAAEAAAAATPVPEPEADTAPAAEPERATAPVPPPGTAPGTDELRWHAFWSPFRSRIAANGFVAQLQRVTGLDYRVVNVRPGVYEVAFAYSEDDEIATNLAQISAATGLDVPGS